MPSATGDRERGEISFFINLPRDDRLMPGEAEELSLRVMDAFSRRVRESGLAGHLSIDGYSWERGCLITSVAVSAAILTVVKGVKDYPDFKRGVIEIAADLNGMTVTLRRWGGRRMSVWFYGDRWSSDSALKKAFRPEKTPETEAD